MFVCRGAELCEAPLEWILLKLFANEVSQKGCGRASGSEKVYGMKE